MKRQNCCIAAAMVCLSCGLGTAEDPGATSAARQIDLKGQIVAITLMSDSEDLVLLSNVSEKQLGGKTLLCGKGVDDGETPDWRNDATVYIPVDDIQQIVSFADLAAYRKKLNARQERLEGKAASSRRRRVPRT